MNKTGKSQSAIRGKHGLRQLCAALVLGCAAITASAHAVIDIYSGRYATASSSLGWEASTDQIHWQPAYTPYPNPITMPDPLLTKGSLMWATDGVTRANGKNGPDHVWFRFSFQLSDVLHTDGLTSFNADIAADDWMQVSVNGAVAGNYLLDENKGSNGQPVAKRISFDLKATGLNEILIEAKDLGEYEWAFFDGDVDPNGLRKEVMFVTPAPSAAAPEPATLALVLLALLGMAPWAQCRRRLQRQPAA